MAEKLLHVSVKELTNKCSQVRIQNSQIVLNVFFSIIERTIYELLFPQVPKELDLPVQIANLIGKTFVFQLELNDYNLKQGWEIYTVKKLFYPVLETDNSIKLDKITDVSTFILNLNNKIRHSLCYLFIS